MRFRARVELSGKTATGIEVPAAVVAKLVSSENPAVVSSLRGRPKLVLAVEQGSR
jgi:hypothetical protein